MDLTRILEPLVPMSVRCLPMADRQGRDTLVVVAKLTWSISARGKACIATPQAPVMFMDQPRSDGLYVSLKRQNDAVEEKPGTDVILVGTAYPQQEGATEQAVTLRVETGHESLQKTLMVYGPRVWQASLLGLAPGPAAKMEPTPIIYENAFGGVDETDGTFAADMRNPAGTGFLERRKTMVGRPAPSIEDRKSPLSGLSPTPAGFGPIPPHWSPRKERIGTYDDTWKRERAPLRPFDFDIRHHSCAPPDQWLETPLVGDEAIEILGATPNGAWRFRLPRYAPEMHVTLRGTTTVLNPHLDTFLIDADALTAELSWRVSIPFPRKTQHLEKVTVYGVPPLPEAMVADLAARVPGFGLPAEET